MYTFKVEDMTCGGCAATVRQSVSRVPGVSLVEADPAAKSVVVQAGTEVSREAIVTAISAAGYIEITTVEAGAATSG